MNDEDRARNADLGEWTISLSEATQRGIFLGSDQLPYKQLWSDGQFRLERITEPGGALTIPPFPASEVEIFGYSNLPRVTIVVGEKGSGRRFFQDWVRRACTRGVPAAQEVFRDAKWASAAFGLVEKALNSGAAAKEHCVFVDLGETAATRDDQVEEHDALAKLAGLVENEPWTSARRVRLIVALRDVRPLMIEDFSSLASRGVVYRLPHFDVGGELEDWIRALRDAIGWRMDVDEEVRKEAAELKSWTGGQPTLVHLFLSRCRDILKETREHRAGIEQAIASLGGFYQRTPPTIVRNWSTQLQHLLQERRGCERLLKRYVTDHGKDRPNDRLDLDDVHLYVAGWVGYRPDGTWTIRSECHREWARQLLLAGAGRRG